MADYSTADVITGKRFVFNIKGNSYRLVADIEFKKKLVFIVWVGTHAEYDKIDVKTVSYVKSD
ncbi:type II toxin-antitoxin system HigB family toxin [uncultured Spirosoma sp.]|uniref:type II toxin-antitoxin system HigB family toxin n=1 Tax=uncultured Spirosoma sp. TaxID=278208 RepID=UPI003458C1CA